MLGALSSFSTFSRRDRADLVPFSQRHRLPTPPQSSGTCLSRFRRARQEVWAVRPVVRADLEGWNARIRFSDGVAGPSLPSFSPLLFRADGFRIQLHHENISSALHGSPADAVDIHLDVRSRNTIGSFPLTLSSLPFIACPQPSADPLTTLSSLGVHFGTFIGSESEALEAMIELHEACEEAGVKNLDDPEEDELGRMGVVDIGETWCCESASIVLLLPFSERSADSIPPLPLPSTHSPGVDDRVVRVVGARSWT